MDAIHTQKATAQQVLDQGGHYVMVAKENQVRRFPDKGHGRHEVRTLECSPMLSEYLDRPGVGLVFRRQCERLILKTGQVSHETTYGITSLRADQVGPPQLETLCRGHWTIENRVH